LSDTRITSVSHPVAAASRAVRLSPMVPAEVQDQFGRACEAVLKALLQVDGRERHEPEREGS
jgi:hypothetical protein